jgi:hypothetical protein
MVVRSGLTKTTTKIKRPRSEAFRTRRRMHVILCAAICLSSSAFGQTTHTSPSASSTIPTIPSSSSTGPNVPCGPFNSTSPCYSARTPRSPCYSALAPNQPCSTTTTPYPPTPPTPSPSNPKGRLTAVHALTQDQAKAQIEAKGYSNVSGLRRDRKGTWNGRAEKDGLTRNVTLDRDGNLTEK